KNVASVMVTASFPPYLKKGQTIDIMVSSLGDATSLLGGTLLLTEVKGPDFNTYAVAQGPVIVGGLSGKSNRSMMLKNQTTVGRIPDGAIVEREVSITPKDPHHITIVLNEPNFVTATRASRAIEEKGYVGVKAMDANTIKIPIDKSKEYDFVETVALLENITFTPDTSSKIVINSRTGTVVIGQMVRLFPVALTHGNVSINIEDVPEFAYTFPGDDRHSKKQVSVKESSQKVIHLSPNSTLSSLVEALNEIGATPKDLVSIIQALKKSGALIASIELI
ncbi:MAG: flagellar basal body P-ring protein FlgI, partial [Candidatus Margulisbacteria bacterium]|nr:flagellar basal body P-ring protein FlgI [Candidatus Margulisiibacteriota bacterium]